MDELQRRLSEALAPSYEIEGEIGRGGMAVVYRGRDARLKRPVAVKLLPPELAFRGDIRTRFIREAETAARLSHPNIVPIYSVDEKEGLVYFIMGLVRGESVGDRLRRAGQFSIADARRTMREVADALAYAHLNGVVHRDIKPDNILLDADSGRAMVTDFGIARAASDDDGGARLTATGAVVGTPAYMSPEQCAGDRAIDGRSDLYSLGTVAYQMLCGEPPFAGGNTPSIMMKQVTEAPVPLRQRRSDVPENLGAIVMRLLAKSPANRFANGAELVAALDGAPVAPPIEEARSAAPMPPLLSPELRQRLGTMPPRARDWLEQRPDVQERIQTAIEDGRSRRARRRNRDDPSRPMAERIHRWHGRVVGYAGTSVFLAGINWATMQHNPHPFWWVVFPVMGMGLGAFTQMSKLLGDGATFGNLFLGKPLSPELAQPPQPAALPEAPRAIIAAAQPHADTNEQLRKGPYGAVLTQAMGDRATVTDLANRLSETERAMLPDVKETADALFARIVALASALQRLEGQVGAERLPALDGRIVAIEQQPADSSDRERRLKLLRRQREMLAELTNSQARLLEQYESAGLLLQNLALDLLKVRSSGLDSAINGLTSATQEARALSKEIGYVLDAANELRKIESS